jgi:hypothetical protein
MKLAAAILLSAVALSAQLQQLEEEITGYVRQLADWGGLTRYGSENAELRPKPGRVVFSWRRDHGDVGEGKVPFFPGKPYLNRGIAGRPRRRCSCGSARM